MAREVLRQTLICAHPFIPFITEAIWSELNNGSPDVLLAVADWPENLSYDSDLSDSFNDAKAVVEKIRSLDKVISPKAKQIVAPEVFCF